MFPTKLIRPELKVVRRQKKRDRDSKRNIIRDSERERERDRENGIVRDTILLPTKLIRPEHRGRRQGERKRIIEWE